MRLMRSLGCAAALTALVALTAPAAHADEANKLTYLTFSGPVQIPGATLAAGTYMFRLADSQSNRHIVQVFDKDGSKHQGQSIPCKELTRISHKRASVEQHGFGELRDHPFSRCCRTCGHIPARSRRASPPHCLPRCLMGEVKSVPLRPFPGFFNIFVLC